MTQIAGSHALITGAASGIGKLLAQELGRKGATLILWDVAADALAATLEALTAEGIKAHSYVCDLTDREAIADCAARTLADLGSVDILINNAGVVAGKGLLDITDAQIERTFQVNTLALFWTTRAFLPGMLERNRGHIVTVASAGGIVGTARLTDYCASKFAAVGFDDSLRIELNRSGRQVRSTVVCPFYVDTGMFAGVKTRFPLLLPILKPAAVVERTVKAIERNRQRVIMPWFVYTSWLARILPVSWFDKLMDFFGISRTMDEFTGR